MIGLAHIDVTQKSPTCALSAIVDPAPATKAIAAKAGVPLYKSLDELFEKNRPDGVILATPNQLHLEQSLKCMAAGVAQLLEKPITPTVREAETLVKEADKTAAKVLIGHHRAHSPIMARAKELIDEGRLGQLVAVMGSAVFFKPDQYFADGPWRREAGGGPILINMIHEVDDLRAMCGEIVEVQALVSNAIRGFPVEDTVALNLRFANGALGTFLLSDTAATARSWEQTSGENSSYASYPDEDCYVIAGVSGSLAVPSMRLKVYAGERSWWKPFETSVVEVQRTDPLSRQLEHFCAVVRGEATPLVSARDALQTLRVTLAIDESARTGRPVATITP